jgi:DNA-binding MarR family transcriptional regulator
MTRMTDQDHIDRFLAALKPVEGLDLEVEGIVDRIGGIDRRIKKSLETTLAEHGLTREEWEVMCKLRHCGDPYRRSPGALAAQLELSSGAMTNRLDRMERAGLVRRLPDPDDRRGVIVELTEEALERCEAAVSTQARREAFFASALSRTEQQQLNGLLRKLMLAFERPEQSGERERTAQPVG